MELSRAGCRGTHLAKAATLPAPTSHESQMAPAALQEPALGWQGCPQDSMLHGSCFLHLPARGVTSWFQDPLWHFLSHTMGIQQR